MNYISQQEPNQMWIKKSIDAGTGRHIDCIDFLFYGSAFEI